MQGLIELVQDLGFYSKDSWGSDEKRFAFKKHPCGCWVERCFGARPARVALRSVGRLFGSHGNDGRGPEWWRLGRQDSLDTEKEF